MDNISMTEYEDIPVWDLPENGTCEDSVDMSLMLHYSLIPSVIFILILSFLEKRKHRNKIDDNVKCLHNRFAFVVPLDLIGAFNDRWTYGFAIGAIANTIILLFDQQFLPAGVPSWAKGLGLLAGALEVGLSYFPIFACLNADNKVIGPLIGFFYTLFWLAVTLADIVICPHETEKREFEKIVSHWPSILCMLFLLCRFVHIFIFRKKPEGVYKDKNTMLPKHQADHIKRLLRKPIEKHKTWFARRIYNWDPCFKFPNRIIGTAVLSLFCLYIFVFAEYNAFKLILHALNYLHQLFLKTHTGISLEDIIKKIQGIWFFTTVFSCLITASYVFHILACYRNQLKSLWAGNKMFLPMKFHKPTSSRCIIAIARYSSWQVAYILWGYSIMHLVQILVGTIFVLLVVYPIEIGIFWDMLKDLLITWFAPFAVVFILVTLQTRLAAIFFLQDKISDEDEQKPLALNNRKAFQNFNYFFFFYNVIVGFGSCLSRLMRSLVIGSWLIARIDRTILPPGFEGRDSGYNTWIGMLYVDHYHSNPVLSGFCHVLFTTRVEKEPSEFVPITNLKEHQTSVRAKTRWFLFYTLIRNPSIIKYRKQFQRTGADAHFIG
ncbi:stimulated by retinoic acid gene 6 protein-like isoform X1 [Pelobates fuscus]|uniref:stimulated by retinoic acid gene 6 protein-like isoform X1 n=1 Tax=Pelobates fuscus TaxID=191477 RepID=UPI002FE47F70